MISNGSSRYFGLSRLRRNGSRILKSRLGVRGQLLMAMGRLWTAARLTVILFRGACYIDVVGVVTLVILMKRVGLVSIMCRA